MTLPFFDGLVPSDATRVRKPVFQRRRTVGAQPQEGPQPAPEPSTTQKIAQLAASFTPGIGEAMSAFDAGGELAKGHLGAAALAGVGAIPFVGRAAKGKRALKAVEEVAQEAAPVKRGIEAWHGSPHDFDRFDLSKIGTGEGAQSYGHGLYFAEAKPVAESYRTAGTGVATTRAAQVSIGNTPIGAFANGSAAFGDVPFSESQKAAQRVVDLVYGLPDDPAAAVKELAASDPSVARLMEKGLTVTPRQPSGKLYKVKINADPEEMLDYDVPLAQQPEKVRQSLATAGREYLRRGDYVPRKSIYDDQWYVAPRNVKDHELGVYRISNASYDTPEAAQAAIDNGSALWQALRGANGSDVVGMIGSDPKGAGLLREAGIPGLRYLDQGSRDILPESWLVTWKNGQVPTRFANKQQAEQFLAENAHRGATGLQEGPRQTRNYVLFDDSRVSILEKLALLGMLGGTGAASRRAVMQRKESDQ